MSEPLKREEMVAYLMGHERYYTANYWNGATSYAHNVKIYRWVPGELRDRAYEMLEVREPYRHMESEFEEFAGRYGWKYQIWWNGRSCGYLVLGQGGIGADGRVYCQPGLGLDMGETFEDWDYESVKRRYDLVKDFDKTVDLCKEIFLIYCKNYRVVEKVKMAPQKYKVLEREVLNEKRQ